MLMMNSIFVRVLIQIETRPTFQKNFYRTNLLTNMRTRLLLVYFVSEQPGVLKTLN